MAAASNGRNDQQAFPELVIDIGSSAQRTPTASATPLGQTVEGALREILAWRPRAGDAQGFVAALSQAFSVTEVEGHTEWSWTPRSYAIQADMGAVTGAQASIYARAKAALDQSLPLLAGLYPLRSDADPQDIEANRAIVRSELTELVSELGMTGGPRLQRVDALFKSLLGANPSQQDPERIAGLLGVMRDRFGLERPRVNTIDEEQNLTNFFILVEHTIALQRSWETQQHFFDRQGRDVFLGTQLVLLSRSMAVVAESVQEAYFVMDSVFLSEGERQTVQLKFGKNRLTIAELLGWVERFSAEEGPRIVREAGKDGVIALRPIVQELANLVNQMWAMSKDESLRIQRGFHTGRVQDALEELKLHVDELAKLFDQLKRQPRHRILAIDPDRSTRQAGVRLIIDGENFQPGAAVYLTEWGEGTQRIDGQKVNVIGTTEIKATFDLSAAPSNKWALVVKNPEPDGTLVTFPEPFWIDDSGPSGEPPQVEGVLPPGAPNTDRVTLAIDGSNFDPGATVALTNDGATIKGSNPSFTEDGQQITATFNIKGKAPGDWTIIVTNPDGQSSQEDEIFVISEPPTISLASATISDDGDDGQIVELGIEGENFQDDITLKVYPPRGAGESFDVTDVDVNNDETPNTATAGDISDELGERVIGSRWRVQVINADGGASKRHPIILSRAAFGGGGGVD
jgi:hypothetical protein